MDRKYKVLMCASSGKLACTFVDRYVEQGTMLIFDVSTLKHKTQILHQHKHK